MKTCWPGCSPTRIRAASPDATLTECLQAAFAAAEVAMTPQQRAKAAQRVLVVAANSELQERGLLKHARIARSISAALRERGADELTARLGAEVGMLAFTIAVERWMEADNDEPFPLHAAAALSDLQVRVAGLGAGRRDQVRRDRVNWAAAGESGARNSRSASAAASPARRRVSRPVSVSSTTLRRRSPSCGRRATRSLASSASRQRDHRGPVHAEALRGLLLGGRLAAGQHEQHRQLPPADAERRERQARSARRAAAGRA